MGLIPPQRREEITKDGKMRKIAGEKTGKRLIAETHKEEGEKQPERMRKRENYRMGEKAVFICWRGLGID